MQPGVKRRGAGRGGKEEGTQHHPQGTWPGLSLLDSGLHCSGSKRKLERGKGEQQHQSNTVCAAQRMEGGSQEDGGKKPGGWREEARRMEGGSPAGWWHWPHPKALWKIQKNLVFKKKIRKGGAGRRMHPHQSEMPENVSQSPI